MSQPEPSPHRPAALDELKWRGLVAISTDEAVLAAALDAGSLTFYCGFDPRSEERL